MFPVKPAAKLITSAIIDKLVTTTKMINTRGLNLITLEIFFFIKKVILFLLN